jgi:capsular polysaccharide transport system permease protein
VELGVLRRRHHPSAAAWGEPRCFERFGCLDERFRRPVSDLSPCVAHNTWFAIVAMQVKSLPPTSPRRSPLRIQRAVLVALVIRDLRARVQGRWQGLLWMLFEPLTHMLLILALFGFRHNASSTTVEYPVFLITGLLPFFIFRNLARKLPVAINASRAVYSYRQVKPIDALAARAVVETGLYAAVYVAALAILGWLGYDWLPHEPLELLVVSFVIIALGTGLGLLFSVLVHGRPKVQTLIGWIFLPMYFLSGVVIPPTSFSPQFREWLMLNPMLHLIELSRSHFFPHYVEMPGIGLAYPTAFTLVVAALGLSSYRLYRHRLVAPD